MTRIKLICTAFLMFILLSPFASPSYAEPAVTQLPPYANGEAPFALAKKDYYVGMLLKGFLGPVINTNGTSAETTISGPGYLGEVFRTFNLGMAFFGTLLVMFIVVVGVLQSGQDGEFLGRKWSSMWVPVRFAIGSVLMLPMSGNGYSFVQAMVLWIALQGIGFADTLWASIVKTVVDRSSSEEMWGMIPSDQLAQNMMSSALCADLLPLYTKDSPVPYKVSFYNKNPFTLTHMTTEWNWGDPDKSSDSKLGKVCGGFTYNYSGFNAFSPEKRIRDKIVIAHTEAINKMGLAFSGFGYGAQIDAALQDPDPVSSKAKLQKINESIAANTKIGAQEYAQAIAAATNSAMTLDVARQRDTIVKNMTDYGFVAAGSFYLELSRFHGAAVSAMKNVPEYTPMDKGQIGSVMIGNGASLMMDYLYNIKMGSSLSEPDGYKAPFEQSGNIRVSNFGDVLPAIGSFFTDADKWITKATLGIAKYILESLVGVGAKSESVPKSFDGGSLDYQQNHNDTGSAILQIKNKGDNILTIGEIIIRMKLTNGADIFADKEVATSEKSDVKAKSKALGYWTEFAPILFAVMGAVFALGFMLSVYIPMVPYILWIGGLIGVTIMIAESLIASSLWAVMIMHPSGDGVTSDQSRAGLMMLLALFTRPALMLMGMVMGMFMIDPLIQLVNDTFYVAAAGLQAGGTWSGIATIIGLGMIYVSLILSIVNRCFSLIHVVPDKVLQWIGGGAANLGEEGIKDSVKGRFTTAGATVSGVMLSNVQANAAQKRAQRGATNGSLSNTSGGTN